MKFLPKMELIAKTFHYETTEAIKSFQYFGITEVCIGFQSFENAFVAAKLHLIKTTLRNLN